MGVKKQIIIEIDEENNIELETRGFKGPECQEELERVTKNFAEFKTLKKTREYYEKAKKLIKKKIGSFSK